MVNQPNAGNFSIQPYTANGRVNDNNVNIQAVPSTVGNTPIDEVGDQRQPLVVSGWH